MQRRRKVQGVELVGQGLGQGLAIAAPQARLQLGKALARQARAAGGQGLAQRGQRIGVQRHVVTATATATVNAPGSSGGFGHGAGRRRLGLLQPGLGRIQQGLHLGLQVVLQIV